MHSLSTATVVNPEVIPASEMADRIVSVARTWIGTPWEHQGRMKGRGVDCANMISMTLMEALPQYADRVRELPNNYRRRMDGKLLKAILDENTEFVLTEERRKGDIIAFCDEALHDRDVPRHLTFVEERTEKTTFVIDPTERGVRRHRLNLYWIERIHSVWRVVPLPKT